MKTIYSLLILMAISSVALAQKQKNQTVKPQSAKTQVSKPPQQQETVKATALLHNYTSSSELKKPAQTDSFKIIENRIKQKMKWKQVDEKVDAYVAGLHADFTKLDAILGSDSLSNIFFQNPSYRDTIFFKSIRMERSYALPVEISYSEVVSAHCMNVDIEIDTTKYKNFNRAVKLRKLVLMISNLISSCMEVDPFPNVQFTPEFANHLHAFIERILNTYEKFQTNIAQYDALEANNNFPELKDKINYRIKFIKYCYAKI